MPKTAAFPNATKSAGSKVVGSTDEPRHRLQFEFSPDAYHRLNDLKISTGASSYADLVRKSLRVYEWVVGRQREGYDIGLVKDGNLSKTTNFV